MLDTVDTTRLNSSDPYTLAVMGSRLIYPDISVSWRPGLPGYGRMSYL